MDQMTSRGYHVTPMPLSGLRANAQGQRVLGVDAEYLVGQILADGTVEDLSGVCAGVERFVRSVSASLKAKAVVVFPGMPYVTQRLDGLLVPVLEELGEGAMQCVMEAVKLTRVAEAMVAPYWSLAQLAALRSPDVGYATDVYGPPELLLFGLVDRVIVNIDPAKTVLGVVMRNDLGVPRGSPDLIERHVERVLYEGPPLSAYMGFRRDGYYDDKHYGAVVCGIHHCPVITRRGECVPLSALSTATGVKGPSCNLSETFGSPLPPLLYYLMMHGVVSPSLAWSYAAGAVFDVTVLAGTTEVQEQSRYVVPLRTQVVHQLAQTFRDTPDNYTMMWVRGCGDEVVTLRRPPKIALDEWDVGDGLAGSVTFRSVLVYTGSAVDPRPETARYRSRQASLCAIHLKALDLLGYFTHGTQPGEEGSGASTFATALGMCEHLEDDLAESAVLLIELLRTQTLHELALSETAAMRDSSRSVARDRLIVRMCSLFPLLGSHWRVGPDASNEHCAVFHEQVVALQRGLRALVEAMAAGVAAHNFPDMVDRAANFAAQLPFFRPPSARAGAVMQFVLECTDQPLLSAVVRRFSSVEHEEDVRSDLCRMMAFWGEAAHMVRHLLEQEGAGGGAAGTLAALGEAVGVMADRRMALGTQ